MSDYGADPDPDTDKIRQVAFGYEIAPLVKLKVDQFSTATSDKVYHLVKKIGSTHLLVRVDPAQIPQ